MIFSKQVFTESLNISHTFIQQAETGKRETLFRVFKASFAASSAGSAFTKSSSHSFLRFATSASIMATRRFSSLAVSFSFETYGINMDIYLSVVEKDKTLKTVVDMIKNYIKFLMKASRYNQIYVISI